ncbi:MAG TPA: carboxypeptidase regulatory-like domain-containing protein, partial [Candidatus Polarisedimenticolia bacterium]|nr:carboxypeptidase regulatory-like domain-containing protein [Candidatus Polarisedimenticolia bacterium]
RMFRPWLRFLIVMVLAAVFALSALQHAGAAVPRAAIRGRVVDRDGHPLPGATVELRFPGESSAPRMCLTDSLGGFRFPDLAGGPGYRLKVSFPSYQTLEFDRITAASPATVVQDIVLLVAFTEKIAVRGEPEVVQTDTAETSTAISSEFIAGLPVLGRDYQDLLTLAPGVTDVNKTGNPNIHGARDVDVITLVDGINTTDPFSGHYGQEMNSESIAEIEIITAGAGAEFSRAQGGFVNLITKSGGNEFTGSFSLYVRSYLLDGDGAGIDPVELRGGVGEKDGYRDLKFSDFYPFVSVSGPIVRDRVWYYLAPEFSQIEVPTNAGTQSYVVQTRSTRATGKLTWQIAPSSKLSALVLFDTTSVDNQGLNSRILLESGYTTTRGGPTFTLQNVTVFRPTVSLESSLSRLQQSFSIAPTLGADTNGNGVLFTDRDSSQGGNQDGFNQAGERDPGEDYDGDGRFDVFEDYNHNGSLDACFVDPDTGESFCSDDIDRDGRVTGLWGCEGREHEDINCNGVLDREFDRDENGVLDPAEDIGIPCANPALCPGGVEPHTRGNGAWDTEDRNGNFLLDTLDNSGPTPFPFWNDRNGDGEPDPGEFTAPLAPDRDYVRDLSLNRISGPFYFDYEDDRTRNTLREDLSLFVAEGSGTHDLKIGGIWEGEGFERQRHDRTYLEVSRTHRVAGRSGAARTIGARIPTVPDLTEDASADHWGAYIQDTFKPLPNLSIGIGLRFDREEVAAWGYEPFDPSEQRAGFDLLTQLVGVEVQAGDLNSDGIVTWDLSRDPLSASDPVRASRLKSELAAVAPRRFTRHNFLTSIVSAELARLGITDPKLLSGGRPRQREDFTISNNNLAPRLSVSWDPRAEGKSKLFASWGRFYGNLFLQTVVAEQGPDFLSPYYLYDADGVGGDALPDGHFGRVISRSPPSASQIERGLRTPFTDELTLGLQIEIAPDASLGLTYVGRKYRDQLQDIELNHSVKRPPACAVNPKSPTYCDDFGFTDPPANDDGMYSREPDGYPDLYVANLNFNQIFRIGNFNYQDYRSYELHLVRRLSRKWQMDASYVYSKARGQAESFLSESGDDPAFTELKDGYLDYDQRHVAKFFATAFLPGDWQLGGGLTWSSGLPYSQVNRFQSNDNVEYIQDRRLFGTRDPNTGIFHPESRNAHRNPSIYDINVRTQKNFVLGRSSASAFLEIFNLLNNDDLRVFEIDDRETSLQAEETRAFGRRFQVGFQLHF